MALVHSKNTFISLGGDDISQYCNTSDLTRGADVSDVTTYGKNAHVHKAGLKKGAASIGGFYDTTASSGPRAVIEPLIGADINPELIRRPEGTGSGKPQDKVDVVVEEYVESAPVAEFATWSAKLTLSDEIDTTPQSA